MSTTVADRWKTSGPCGDADRDDRNGRKGTRNCGRHSVYARVQQTFEVLACDRPRVSPEFSARIDLGVETNFREFRCVVFKKRAR